MKPYCSVIITLLLAVTLGIGQADTSKQKPQTPGANTIKPQNPIPASKSQPQKAKKELWPRTFVPSEKITADSVVSFPADI
jgi:hypothetical protein